MARSPNLRIGTRGSPLALAQAEQVKALLTGAFPDLGAVLEIVVIKTTGDMITDRPLSEAGGKGLFTKEIDDAMLDENIDIAVHSMKDVPTWLPDGIVLPCMLEREDPRDAFISAKATSLDGLAEGSVVGTASLRRQAQVLARRPDLKVVSFRGNVQTRLDKLAKGEVDATLLAQAGLNRLGRPDVATSIIETIDMLPAVGQGAIGITCRDGDRKALHFLGSLNHPETVACVTAERALLEVLDGSCRTPIAALAEVAGGRLTLRGLIAKPDGTQVLETSLAGGVGNAEAIGQDAGHDLLDRAGPDFLESA